jgi:hypothetical protein
MGGGRSKLAENLCASPFNKKSFERDHFYPDPSRWTVPLNLLACKEWLMDK